MYLNNYWSYAVLTVTVYFENSIHSFFQVCFFEFTLALWRPLLPYGYSYKESCARPGWEVICNFWHPDTQPWASECPGVKNYKWRLNSVWRRLFYSCAHMATTGVKGSKSLCVHRYRIFYQTNTHSLVRRGKRCCSVYMWSVSAAAVVQWRRTLRRFTTTSGRSQTRRKYTSDSHQHQMYVSIIITIIINISYHRARYNTRSQAVARIADRTAKNCRGHVTKVTPTFRGNFCAPVCHSPYKAVYQIWSL